MPRVICEPCINVKHTCCVEVCPVDCIHPTREEEGFDAAEQLYINPDECIDCGACESDCPAQAICADTDVPEKWQDFIQKTPTTTSRVAPSQPTLALDTMLG